MCTPKRPATAIRTDALLSEYNARVRFRMSLKTAALSFWKNAFAGNLESVFLLQLDFAYFIECLRVFYIRSTCRLSVS